MTPEEFIKKIYPTLNESDKAEAEKMFPQLAESEDEKKWKKVERALRGFFRFHESDELITWLKKYKEPKDKGEISDGYHTFNELYYYRMLYNAAFFNFLPKEWVHKSKKHHDGKDCFDGGWFIVMANLPTGQISNHYELKDWNLFQIPEKEIADEWDGHTPQEAAERLHKFLLKRQKSVEWSEKDEEMLGKLQRLIILCCEDLKYIVPREFDDLNSWLKALHNRFA